MVTIIIAPSLANKAGVLADTDKACSNRRGRKDEYYDDKSTIAAGRVYTKM